MWYIYHIDCQFKIWHINFCLSHFLDNVSKSPLFGGFSNTQTTTSHSLSISHTKTTESIFKPQSSEQRRSTSNIFSKALKQVGTVGESSSKFAGASSGAKNIFGSADAPKSVFGKTEHKPVPVFGEKSANVSENVFSTVKAEQTGEQESKGKFTYFRRNIVQPLICQSLLTIIHENLEMGICKKIYIKKKIM